MTYMADDGNESGAISTPVEDDATGVDQAQQPISDASPQEQQRPQDGQRLPGLSAPQGPLAGAGKRIISYLMGADAAHPQTIDQVGQQIDPGAKMTPADRNLLSIQHVRDSEGDNAAWQLMQANRVSYNAHTAFALTALNGTPQKPADVNAAINAANKAQANVLDGSTVHFAPRGDLVTATVNIPGTSQQQHIVLSKDQFAQWLNVGGDGQWDKVMSQSAPAVLQRLAASGPSRGATRLPQQPQRSAPAGQARPQAQAPAAKSTFGSTPSAIDLSDDENVRAPTPPTGQYDEETEARSTRMFPQLSQDPQRQAWMAGQEEKEALRENAVTVAGEKGKHAEEVARITGTGREKVAGITSEAKVKGWQYASDAKKAVAQINADQKAAQQGNVDARQRIESARKAIATKRMTAGTLTPEDEALEKQLTAQGSAAAQPQQRQPRQSSPGQPPVPGAKQYKGRWYTRGPNGESVPVQ